MQAQIHFARLLIEFRKPPEAIQLLKGAFVQTHLDCMRCLAGILRGKTLLELQIINLNRCNHQGILADFNAGSTAPRQELRIVFYLIHQIEHLLRGVPNQYRFFNERHYSTDRSSARPDAKAFCKAGRIRDFAPDFISPMSIVQNKKAFHDYFIEEKFEAGIALEGWEVKAICAGRAQLKESYVIINHGELFLIGSHISPLPTASTHVHPNPTRTRKLLLHAEEIQRLIAKVERAGYTLIALNIHYTRGRIKLEIGLAKGKKKHDIRETEKERDWQREKQRLVRTHKE